MAYNRMEQKGCLSANGLSVSPFLHCDIFHGNAALLRKLNFARIPARYRISERPQLVAFGEHLLSHGKTKLPVDGVILVQHLRIEQMGREKSVPFVFHELARFLGKFRIPFDVPGVGGRHINEFHKASVSYFGAACTMVRVVLTAACAV
jgi:hypothetical protein